MDNLQPFAIIIKNIIFFMFRDKICNQMILNQPNNQPMVYMQFFNI